MNALARRASITLDLNSSFIPLILNFAEESAKAFGFTDSDVLRVRLASEEIFGYLCHTTKAGSEVTVEALNMLYHMEIRFTFKARSFDPYAFNLTALVMPDEGQTENLGLLIGSRSVDRFSIVQGQPDGLVLSLVKDKTYPPFLESERVQGTPLKGFVVKKPDDEMVKRFVHSGVSQYDETNFPPSFRLPGRMVDMITQGDYQLLVACGTGMQGGEVGGGIIWRFMGKAMIQFYGPYVFSQSLRIDIARALVDAFLSAVAKTDRSGAFGHCTTADLPREYFEPIGDIEYRLESGGKQMSSFFYRQLKEDTGSNVWAGEQLGPFLHTVYDRLYLPRRIVPAMFEGEKLAPHSVFSVKFDRPLNAATIRPVWDGEDHAKNIAGHVNILQEEGLTNIFFYLDLGVSWQAKLVPALFANSFRPVLLLPYAGHADVVVFQRVG
jgi:hypothetical protein